MKPYRIVLLTSDVFFFSWNISNYQVFCSDDPKQYAIVDSAFEHILEKHSVLEQ